MPFVALLAVTLCAITVTVMCLALAYVTLHERDK